MRRSTTTAGRAFQYPHIHGNQRSRTRTLSDPTLGDAITWSTGLTWAPTTENPFSWPRSRTEDRPQGLSRSGYSWSQDRYASVPPRIRSIFALWRSEHCKRSSLSDLRPDNELRPRLIQFDEYAVDTPFTNQALNWGSSRMGFFVDGNPVTATGNSVTAYLGPYQLQSSLIALV